MELEFSLRPTAEESASEEGAPEVENVVILGGGIAGFTAAIYAGRSGLNPLVIVGNALGGQAAMTEAMENYPGFPDGIGGVDLAELVQKQAVKFGARLEHDLAIEVDFSVRPFVVKTYGRTIKARTVIIATGATPRRLFVPGEDKFIGRGISFCATCDGYFYRDKTVAVIGGGNSALDEGLYLARLAKQVYVIHRRDQLRAEKILQERAFRNPKMSFIWNTVVEEVLGEDHVTGLKLRNVKTGEVSVLPVDGVFEYIGMQPNTEIFRGQIELDANGYIITDKRQHTNIEGVFAAGDVQSPDFQQAVIAAGTGAAAAIEAERYLAKLEE